MTSNTSFYQSNTKHLAGILSNTMRARGARGEGGGDANQQAWEQLGRSARSSYEKIHAITCAGDVVVVAAGEQLRRRLAECHQGARSSTMGAPRPRGLPAAADKALSPLTTPRIPSSTASSPPCTATEPNPRARVCGSVTLRAGAARHGWGYHVGDQGTTSSMFSGC
jgi:hypothetical protein